MDTDKKLKRNRIIYWIFTIWMSFGMLSSGILQIMQVKEEVALFDHLGFPMYFATIIGVWKLLGVTVALIPGFLILKEWAYAGFVFTMTSAFICHLIMKDGMGETFPPVFLLLITVISYYYRPANRRITLS